MTTIITTTIAAQKDKCILQPFRKPAIGEGILKAGMAIRKYKENGYVRYYYPENDIIEEISPTGIKVKFSFNRLAFNEVEREDPRKAAVFYRYNAELFGSVSCSIAYLTNLYGHTLTQIKREIDEAEKELLIRMD